METSLRDIRAYVAKRLNRLGARKQRIDVADPELKRPGNLALMTKLNGQIDELDAIWNRFFEEGD